MIRDSEFIDFNKPQASHESADVSQLATWLNNSVWNDIVRAGLPLANEVRNNHPDALVCADDNMRFAAVVRPERPENMAQEGIDDPLAIALELEIVDWRKPDKVQAIFERALAAAERLDIKWMLQQATEIDCRLLRLGGLPEPAEDASRAEKDNYIIWQAIETSENAINKLLLALNPELMRRYAAASQGQINEQGQVLPPLSLADVRLLIDPSTPQALREALQKRFLAAEGNTTIAARDRVPPNNEPVSKLIADLNTARLTMTSTNANLPQDLRLLQTFREHEIKRRSLLWELEHSLTQDLFNKYVVLSRKQQGADGQPLAALSPEDIATLADPNTSKEVREALQRRFLAAERNKDVGVQQRIPERERSISKVIAALNLSTLALNEARTALPEQMRLWRNFQESDQRRRIVVDALKHILDEHQDVFKRYMIASHGQKKEAGQALPLISKRDIALLGDPSTQPAIRQEILQRFLAAEKQIPERERRLSEGITLSSLISDVNRASNLSQAALKVLPENIRLDWLRSEKYGLLIDASRSLRAQYLSLCLEPTIKRNQEAAAAGAAALDAQKLSLLVQRKEQLIEELALRGFDARGLPFRSRNPWELLSAADAMVEEITDDGMPRRLLPGDAEKWKLAEQHFQLAIRLSDLYNKQSSSANCPNWRDEQIAMYRSTLSELDKPDGRYKDLALEDKEKLSQELSKQIAFLQTMQWHTRFKYACAQNFYAECLTGEAKTQMFKAAAATLQEAKQQLESLRPSPDSPQSARDAFALMEKRTQRALQLCLDNTLMTNENMAVEPRKRLPDVEDMNKHLVFVANQLHTAPLETVRKRCEQALEVANEIEQDREQIIKRLTRVVKALETKLDDSGVPLSPEQIWELRQWLLLDVERLLARSSAERSLAEVLTKHGLYKDALPYLERAQQAAMRLTEPISNTEPKVSVMDLLVKVRGLVREETRELALKYTAEKNEDLKRFYGHSAVLTKTFHDQLDGYIGIPAGTTMLLACMYSGRPLVPTLTEEGAVLSLPREGEVEGLQAGDKAVFAPQPQKILKLIKDAQAAHGELQKNDHLNEFRQMAQQGVDNQGRWIDRLGEVAAITAGIVVTSLIMKGKGSQMFQRLRLATAAGEARWGLRLVAVAGGMYAAGSANAGTRYLGGRSESWEDFKRDFNRGATVDYILGAGTWFGGRRLLQYYGKNMTAENVGETFIRANVRTVGELVGCVERAQMRVTGELARLSRAGHHVALRDVAAGLGKSEAQLIGELLTPQIPAALQGLGRGRVAVTIITDPNNGNYLSALKAAGGGAVTQRGLLRSIATAPFRPVEWSDNFVRIGRSISWRYRFTGAAEALVYRLSDGTVLRHDLLGKPWGEAFIDQAHAMVPFAGPEWKQEWLLLGLNSLMLGMEGRVAPPLVSPYQRSRLILPDLWRYPLHRMRSSETLQRGFNTFNHSPAMFILNAALPHGIAEYPNFKKYWAARKAIENQPLPPQLNRALPPVPDVLPDDK